MRLGVRGEGSGVRGKRPEAVPLTSNLSPLTSDLLFKDRTMSHERYPKEIVLKDGKEVILRPAVSGDHERIARFFRTLLWNSGGS